MLEDNEDNEEDLAQLLKKLFTMMKNNKPSWTKIPIL
jgi:hypothetical protein